MDGDATGSAPEDRVGDGHVRRGAARQFHWTEFEERIAALEGSGPFCVSSDGRTFEAERVTVVAPLVVPVPDDLRTAAAKELETARERAARLARRERGARESDDPLQRFVRALPVELPLQAMVLMQAGATAIGMFERGKPVATKSFKRYVTRGNGKAQATFLKTKGKSRYGSRLRLGNAKRQLEETAERIATFWRVIGVPEQVFVGVPVRLRAELIAASPELAKSEDEGRVVRVPKDVPVPTTEVMVGCYRRMEWGEIRRTGAAGTRGG